MKKIEFWRKVKENGGGCYSIRCNECPYSKKGDGCTRPDCKTKKYAESYIKRHEQKCKKKNHIRDAKKKVEEPKPVEELTPLEIAKMIRDNGYSCLDMNDDALTGCRACPLGRHDCGSMIDTADLREKNLRKKLIDDYISANEPTPFKTVGIDNDDVTLAKPTVSVPCEHLINGDSCGNAFEPCEEECPANSEYPQPIRVDIPDIFYCPTPQGILRFKRSQVCDLLIILKDTNNDDCLLKLHEEYPCYRTLEEAVIVAKKLWKGEGK